MITLLFLLHLSKTDENRNEITHNPDSLLIYYNEKGYPFAKIVVDSLKDGQYFVKIIKGEKVIIKKIGLSNISPSFWELLPYYFRTESHFQYSLTKLNEIKRKFEKKVSLKSLKPVTLDSNYILYGRTKNNEELNMNGGITYSTTLSGNLSFSLLNILNRYEKFTILVSAKSKSENSLQLQSYFPFILKKSILRKLYTEEKITLQQINDEKKVNFYGLIGYYLNYYIRAGAGMEIESNNFNEYFIFSHYNEDDGYPFSLFKNEVFAKIGTDYDNFYRFKIFTNINRTYKNITCNLSLYSHLLNGEKPLITFGGIKNFPGFSDNSIVEQNLLFSGIKIGYNTGYTYVCIFYGYAHGNEKDYTSIMAGLNLWFNRNILTIYSGYNKNIDDFIVQINWEVNI